MIQIKTNIDGTFDLFNHESNSRITNESYSSIEEINNYFITEKNEKFGLYSVTMDKVLDKIILLFFIFLV
jgi:hypothetical protein